MTTFSHFAYFSPYFILNSVTARMHTAYQRRPITAVSYLKRLVYFFHYGNRY